MFLKHQHHIPRLRTSVRCLSTQYSSPCAARAALAHGGLQAATAALGSEPLSCGKETVLGQPCSSAQLLQRSHGAPAALVTHWCEGERQDSVTWRHTTPTKCCSCATVTKPALFCTVLSVSLQNFMTQTDSFVAEEAEMI